MSDRGPDLADEAPAPPPVLAAAQAVPWPAWPGWLVAMAGAIALITGVVGIAMADQGQLPATYVGFLLGAAAGGGVALLSGLVYQALRSIRARRHLPASRYRGASVILLLGLALIVSVVVALPFAADSLALFEGKPMSLAGSIVLLTGTQVALVAVTWLFVVLPRALPGVPAFDGGAALRSVARGLGFGAVAWLGATLVGAAAALGLEALGLPITPEPAEQAIAGVNPLVVVVALVLVAPLAEEIFFRGVVFNAWLREYGRRRALFGSAVLFALIHVSLVALLPIFLLGLALAWIYDRTRSLLSAVVMHATVNGISVAIALLVRFGMIDLPA